MPQCSRVVELLVEYLESRLPPAMHAALERHLAACPACVAHLRTYRATVSLLRSVTEEELPPELRMALRAFIDRGATN